uniref:NADH-ubiquinone oxidoreductase chain 1 n=1 Tax=Nallachius americanus TaxID=560880 RepID=A0A1S5QY38_9NEOP|nr:NADH dehydrogenase subunit 1 [Nallachius americanus]
MYINDLMISMLGIILMIICVLVGVAFLTLMERKVLGYIQLRKGPNKVGIVGFMQPFSDAIKLFSKEQVYPVVSTYLSYYISPIFSLLLALLMWIVFPYYSNLVMMEFGMLFMLCCLSMGVYGVLVAGWSSNSSYAMLGGLRSVAQTISYEVSMALLLMFFMLMIGGFNLFMFMEYQCYLWFLWISLPLMLIWLVTSLAETNRTPFDFAEGESELVSGFNIEYSSGGFALIFLAEYASILFMSVLLIIMFLGADIFSIIFYVKVSLIGFLFIWVRATLPRYRYDKLMYLAWKGFLPISLNYLGLMLGLLLMMMYLN